MGAVNVQPLVYRLVCKNGMIVNDAQTRRNHVGRVNEADENFLLYGKWIPLEAGRQYTFLTLHIRKRSQTVA